MRELHLSRKKIASTLAITLALTIGMGRISHVAAAGASLSLTPATVSTSVGQTFSIKIDLDTGGVDTDGTRAILLYNKDLLEVTKVTPGSTYDSYPDNATIIDAAIGTVKISGLATDGNVFSGSGTFATVDFSAKAPGTATIKIDFVGPYDANNPETTRHSNVADSNNPGVTILTQVSNATVTIAQSPTGGTKTPSGKLPNTASLTPTVIVSSAGGLFILLGLLLFFAL